MKYLVIAFVLLVAFGIYAYQKGETYIAEDKAKEAAATYMACRFRHMEQHPNASVEAEIAACKQWEVK
jgi:hypothetical protein